MTEQQILQKRMAQFLVNDVFNTITDEDILKKENDLWHYKGNALPEGSVQVLKKEAQVFAKMSIYPILCSEIRHHARKALEKAETESDIISAKLLSYFVDVLESKVKKIAEL